jgi:hypothetical protein
MRRRRIWMLHHRSRWYDTVKEFTVPGKVDEIRLGLLAAAIMMIGHHWWTDDDGVYFEMIVGGIRKTFSATKTDGEWTYSPPHRAENIQIAMSLIAGHKYTVENYFALSIELDNYAQTCARVPLDLSHIDVA